jgi:hypothetical protein
MCKKLSFSSFLFLTLFSISTFSPATLIDRGSGMIYDDALNVTWLQDATHLTHDHVAAVAWVEALEYAGYDDWRLPTVLASDGPDGHGNILNVTESEVSHLLLHTLSNTINPAAPLGTLSVELNDCGPFLDLTYAGCGGEHFDHPWWLDASAEGPDITYWSFNVWAGEHTPHHTAHSGFVWAVRDGDVTVPEPSMLFLLASGIAVFFIARKLENIA